MASVLIWWAWKHERERGHPLFAHWPGVRPALLLRLLGLGWPAASQLIFEVGAFSAATLLAGRLSPDILAAHQIVLNSASLTYMVPLVPPPQRPSRGPRHRGRESCPRPAQRFHGHRHRRRFHGSCGNRLLDHSAPAGTHIHPRPRNRRRGGAPAAVAAAFQIFDGIQGISTGALRAW